MFEFLSFAFEVLFMGQNLGEYRSRPQKARPGTEWRALSRHWSRSNVLC